MIRVLGNSDDKKLYLDKLYTISLFLCLPPGLELLDVTEKERITIFTIARTIRLLCVRDGCTSS